MSQAEKEEPFLPTIAMKTGVDIFKKIGLNLVLMTAITLGASAQTLFTGGATDSVTVAGNWTPSSLPTSVGNPGTISSDAGWDANTTNTLVDYYLNITGGTFERTTGINNNFTGGVISFNGGNFQGRGVLLDGTSFTINSGTVNTTDNSNDDFRLSNSAVFTMSGGALNVSDTFAVTNTGGTVNLSGGTITSTGFNDAFGSGGTYNLSGGIINGGTYGVSTNSGTLINFQTGTAGAVNFTSYLSTNTTLDWDTGSSMSLTITGADATFYQNLYTGGGLLFEGANIDPFGNNFQVVGETLSLVPEPSTFALLGLGLGTLFVLRRRAGR